MRWQNAHPHQRAEHPNRFAGKHVPLCHRFVVRVSIHHLPIGAVTRIASSDTVALVAHKPPNIAMNRNATNAT